MDTSIGVCVVGYGMGRFHCEGLRQLPDFHLIAVCEIDDERLQRAIDEQGVKGYQRLRDALRDDEVQLVVLATPHDTHASLAVQVMNAGKHCIVEKVMCTSVREADRMLSACERNGVLLSVFQNRRWDSDYLTVKRICEHGLIGEPFEYQSAVGGYGRPRGWRAERERGGGMLYDWGAHLIDQALQMVRSSPKWVFANLHYRHWDVDVETHSQVWIRFDNDVLFNIELSNLSRIPRVRWRILGTLGTVVKESFDPNEKARVCTSINGTSVDMRIDTVRGDWLDYYRNIADVLLRNAELAVKPEETRDVVRVIEAAIKSSKTGRAVKLSM
ncbi:MAG TPA: Gfo/Idh/MocA family oxidoreductase [Armatimonadetes bacterium]|nr:Gfo/Idh/MocA family oxidoreductase [Armatimonadota bacterium]